VLLSAARFSDTTERGVTLVLDITERKYAERERERLLQAEHAARAEAEEANRAKMDFLSAMSHELRTPLNAIGGYVELLDMGIHGPVTESQQTALSRITANQRHLLILINDILVFAKLEAGQVEFDLRSLSVRRLLLSVEPLVAPSAAAKGIAYSVQERDTDLVLLGDEERVRQIVLNLVTNAIKFTEEGGWVLLSYDADAEFVRIRVSDNGSGIAPEKHQAIFDPFVQVDRRLNRRREGVGLGLAISRDFARAMNGELSVESNPGAGSTFSLTLPRGPAE
jgi:signal transduction histidine kinase